MEADCLAAGGAVKADGQRNQAELQLPFPDRGCHTKYSPRRTSFIEWRMRTEDARRVFSQAQIFKNSEAAAVSKRRQKGEGNGPSSADVLRATPRRQQA